MNFKKLEENVINLSPGDEEVRLNTDDGWGG